MAKAAMVAVGLMLAGCVSGGWQKPGGTARDFQRDAYDCERDIRQSVHPGGLDVRAGYFERCLMAHGWENNAGDKGFSAAVPR